MSYREDFSYTPKEKEIERVEWLSKPPKELACTEDAALLWLAESLGDRARGEWALGIVTDRYYNKRKIQELILGNLEERDGSLTLFSQQVFDIASKIKPSPSLLEDLFTGKAPIRKVADYEYDNGRAFAIAGAVTLLTVDNRLRKKCRATGLADWVGENRDKTRSSWPPPEKQANLTDFLGPAGLALLDIHTKDPLYAPRAFKGIQGANQSLQKIFGERERVSNGKDNDPFSWAKDYFREGEITALYPFALEQKRMNLEEQARRPENLDLDKEILRSIEDLITNPDKQGSRFGEEARLKAVLYLGNALYWKDPLAVSKLIETAANSTAIIGYFLINGGNGRILSGKTVGLDAFSNKHNLDREDPFRIFETAEKTAALILQQSSDKKETQEAVKGILNACDRASKFFEGQIYPYKPSQFLLDLLKGLSEKYDGVSDDQREQAREIIVKLTGIYLENWLRPENNETLSGALSKTPNATNGEETVSKFLDFNSISAPLHELYSCYPKELTNEFWIQVYINFTFSVQRILPASLSVPRDRIEKEEEILVDIREETAEFIDRVNTIIKLMARDQYKAPEENSRQLSNQCDQSEQVLDFLSCREFMDWLIPRLPVQRRQGLADVKQHVVEAPRAQAHEEYLLASAEAAEARVIETKVERALELHGARERAALAHTAMLEKLTDALGTVESYIGTDDMQRLPDEERAKMKAEALDAIIKKFMEADNDVAT